MSGVFFQARASKILARVAQHYGVSTFRIVSRDKRQNMVTLRWICMWLMSEAGGSSVQIGEALGGRDHATVLHGLAEIRRMANTHQDVRTALDAFQLSAGNQIRGLVAAGAGL